MVQVLTKTFVSSRQSTFMQVVPTPGCRPDTRCRFAAHLTNLLPRFARSIPAAGNPQQEFADERIDRRPTLGRIPPRSGQDLFVNAESDISHVTHVMCKCVNRQGDLTEMAGGDKPRWATPLKILGVGFRCTWPFAPRTSAFSSWIAPRSLRACRRALSPLRASVVRSG